MKKLIVVLSAVAFAGAIFAQQITNVRLSPAKSSYNAGEQVTIKWDYTGLSIPSTDPVKITLWREGTSQNICKIAENIRISTGTSGYQWRLPSTCTNPHTGATEDLTRGNLKIRVRWQGHPVWGESSGFQIKKISYFTNINPKNLKPRINLKAAMSPRIYDIKMVKHEGANYKIIWKYENIPDRIRPYIFLYKNGSSICGINIVPASYREQIFNFFAPCGNNGNDFVAKEEFKKDGSTYQIVFDFSAYSGWENIKFYSQPINPFLYPELKIDDIRISHRRGASYALVMITITNLGPAPSSPFGLIISGNDVNGYNFTKTIHTQTGWAPKEHKTVAFRLDENFVWYNCCIRATLIKDGTNTNGYNPNTPEILEKCFSPPHVTGH